MFKLPQKYEYIDLMTDEPYILGQMLGFKDLRRDLHNDWIRSIILSQKDFTLLAHRGSYKTTCLTIGLMINLILQPNITSIFLRKTDVDVKEVIMQIYKLCSSELMRHIVKSIYGVDLVFTTATAFALDTNLKTSNKGACQLTGLGIKTSITGKHADRVITDDIVNVKDRISGPEREATKLAYMELQNIRNRGGVIINTGTPWHKNDAISLMPNISKYDCYYTKLITPKKLEEIKKSMTPSLFAANYELRHIASDDVIFDNPRINEDFKLVLNGIAHVDAAYGGEDYTAFTVCKKQDDKYYVFGKMWHKHVDECLDEIAMYIQETRASKIYCENNGDKGYLAKELRKKGLKAVTYRESQNKFLKITTYLKGAWENVLFVCGTDTNYIDQICDFNEYVEHDDAPDSLSSIIRRLYSKNTENFESVLGLI
ncbi:MAG: hypothetical protein IKQ46_10530 [Bacteroidales bacterium]|nr:hypothetical protein [Bacteroidales bacterium]